MILGVIGHASFKECNTLFQGADVPGWALVHGNNVCHECIGDQDYADRRTVSFHRDIAVALVFHMHTPLRRGRTTCNRGGRHHTGRTSQTIGVSRDYCQRPADSETLTRCLRRLHLLQANVTRGFLGAVVAGGPAALLAVEAAFAESWPIRSEDCGEDGAAFRSSDGLWPSGRECL